MTTYQIAKPIGDIIVVADLHLSPYHPALTQAFLAFIRQLIEHPPSQLIILGDWFEAWIGDDAYLQSDKSSPFYQWLTPIVTGLQRLSERACFIQVMRGNRDFLLGQTFCDYFSGTLQSEPLYLNYNERIYRLEHGDALCLDDTAYQSFRKVVRDPDWQADFLAKPLKERQNIAELLRLQSKQENQKKSSAIMDVRFDAVAGVLKQTDHLIHGHTHRPSFHIMKNRQTRYVLGDWRLDKNTPHVKAVIGIFNHGGFKLHSWTHQ